MINGLLQIDKPKAESSASYIRRLSKLEPELKIGHCGTLDPMATGILLVCLNQMTRFASYLSSSEKTYRACISFGKKTSTGDSEGEIIESKEFSFLDFSSKDVENTIQKFQGKSKQKPPAFSALKYKGKSLYEYARKGIKIDKDEREIFISSIKLLSIMGNEINIEVSCSSGTYIRSLAEDIGELFNCPAYLKDLRRTRSGNFFVKNAIKLPEDRLPVDKIISPNDALNCFNEIQCAPDIVDKLRNGQFVESNFKYDSSTILRLRDSKRGFIGLVEYNEGLLKPKRFLENFLSLS
jgi:tRNA pseudouridine55 synthase